MKHAGIVLGVLVVAAASCEPIEPRPISLAPVNECPCERFEPGPRSAARCTESRCEIAMPSNRPDFQFWILVHVPETSIYAAGFTYVLYADATGNPAFRERALPGIPVLCNPPLCLPLDGVANVTGSYIVTRSVAAALGYPLPDDTPIPVRVVYEPMGNQQQAEFPSLPLDRLFTSSRIESLDDKTKISSVIALPFGNYRRVYYPQPPFDEIFPPVAAEQPINVEVVSDDVLLVEVATDPEEDPRNAYPVDDLHGDSREANIRREEGLDGWRAWLVDRPTQRRISVIRTLSGTDATVQLHTAGEVTEGGGLGDVEAVVAPPESWTAVPRLVTPLFGGAGLKNIVYPSLPPPATVSGVVGQPGSDGFLLGYAATVTFESESTSLLRYSTTVATDDRGRFATVLPHGTYLATIEPAEGTGFAKTRQSVVIDRENAALTFRPPARTLVRGRAVLTDGRPLSGANVLANPDPTPTEQLVPRPGRARTAADGRFTLELDPGSYVFSVVPKEGTGFPRVVVRHEVPARQTELPDVRIPAPSPLSFTLRSPYPPGPPIQRAIVRIFALPASLNGAAGSVPVEIGSSMTDSEGRVEILLAQEPR